MNTNEIVCRLTENGHKCISELDLWLKQMPENLDSILMDNVVEVEFTSPDTLGYSISLTATIDGGKRPFEIQLFKDGNVAHWASAPLWSVVSNTTEFDFLTGPKVRVIDPYKNAGAMTAARAKQIAFCALQLLRKEMRGKSDKDTDWKDVDDRLFSELDVETGELEEIYAPYNTLVYAGSCFEDEHSPKNYDVVHYSNV